MGWLNFYQEALIVNLGYMCYDDTQYSSYVLIILFHIIYILNMEKKRRKQKYMNYNKFICNVYCNSHIKKKHQKTTTFVQNLWINTFLNTDKSYLWNSVDPDQLPLEIDNWSGSALFLIYVCIMIPHYYLHCITIYTFNNRLKVLDFYNNLTLFELIHL